jgi:ABC-type nitrate/sulfonate/bicarbonate transport system permease component
MKTLLKLEELAQLLLAVFVFAHLPFAWWVLPATFLLPDLSMLGYLAGPRVGAASYNLAHHKALAIAVGVAGWALGLPLGVLAGTILLFHSAFDRLLGYGLKYSTGFQDTHLGRVGKAPAVASPAVA